MKNKSTSELAALRQQVMQRLASPDDAVDVEYWEQLRARVDVDLARALLSDIHRDLLRQRLELLVRFVSLSEN